MATQARKIIDQMFSAFQARNLEDALATVSEDTLWVHHGSQKMMSVRFEGKSGASSFFKTSFDTMKIEYFRPLRFIEEGNTVVVLGEEKFTMDGIEGTLINQWVQVYTVENGLITKMEEFATSTLPDAYLVINPDAVTG
jgi:ketosteroid isomerase-like protein